MDLRVNIWSIVSYEMSHSGSFSFCLFLFFFFLLVCVLFFFSVMMPLLAVYIRVSGVILFCYSEINCSSPSVGSVDQVGVYKKFINLNWVLS